MQKVTKRQNVQNNNLVEEMKRHTTVLMEYMDTRLKVVTEQYGSINERCGSIQKEIGDFRDQANQRFDRLEIAVLENSRDIRRLEGSMFDNHEKRLRRLEHKAGV